METTNQQTENLLNSIITILKGMSVQESINLLFKVIEKIKKDTIV